MDEVLRRRLVGAAVLLAAAFALASLLPDRHAERGPGASGLPAAHQVSRAPGPAGPEGPVAEAPQAEPPAAPRPALKVDEKLGVAPGSGGWQVQIGSFENQANAQRVLQKLYGAGLPATIQSVPVDRRLWYRVRVGPYRDEAAAQAGLAAVRAQGYPLARIVRPDPAPAREGN
jgi:DedD protein